MLTKFLLTFTGHRTQVALSSASDVNAAVERAEVLYNRKHQHSSTTGGKKINFNSTIQSSLKAAFGAWSGRTLKARAAIMFKFHQVV